MGKILVLLMAGNLLLGGGLFVLRSPWRPAEESSPPELPSQAQELAARIAAGAHGEPFTLALSDEELTAVAAYFLSRTPDVPFGRVTIAVADDNVVVDGVTRGLAVTVPVRASGTVTARGGLPVARVDSVRLGETPLPGFARDQIVRQANASLDFSRYNLPLTVDALELRRGGMTVRGTLK